MFLLITWEVGRIVFEVRFDVADVEGIVDKRESTIHWQVAYIVVPLRIEVLDVHSA